MGETRVGAGTAVVPLASGLAFGCNVVGNAASKSDGGGRSRVTDEKGAP
ncbi:MAG: hypothetical protein ACO3JL_04045 [Myxococcota bacterium]